VSKLVVMSGAAITRAFFESVHFNYIREGRAAGSSGRVNSNPCAPGGGVQR